MFFFDHARRMDIRPKSLFDERAESIQGEVFSYLRLPDKERLQTDVPPVWKYTFEPDVLEALSELSFGKCPFCDTPTTALRPYRFRPPAHATPNKGPEDKYSYLWLAFNWRNLFPICDDCIPTDKSYFRVRGRRAEFSSIATHIDVLESGLKLGERAVLYYPGETEQPYEAFGINLEGELQPISTRAPETINQFKLNRPELVGRRAQVLRDQIASLRRGVVMTGRRGMLATEPFGGARYLLLAQLARHMEHYFSGRYSKSSKGIVKAFEQWCRADNFRSALEEALKNFDALLSGDAFVPSITKFAAAPTSPASVTSGPYAINHPRLTKIMVANFKSLESIEFEMPTVLSDAQRKATMLEELTEVPDAPAVMILGENSTGKSSILEAIALACLRADLRDGLELKPGRLTTNPEYMGAEIGKLKDHLPRRSHVELTFDGGKTFTLDIDQESFHQSASDEGDPDTRPYLFAYGAHRLYGKVHREDELRHVDTLFSDDKQISNPESWLARLSRERTDALNEVVSALRHIIQIDGRFEHIEVRRDEEEQKDICLIKIVRQLADGTSRSLFQRLDVASSGYKAVLAVVCDVFEKLMAAEGVDPHTARNAKAIVLIDEIEAHLHPRWKLQIVSGLRRALPGVTFLFTSHDPLCVRGMFPGEVMMLNRYQNEGSVEDGTLPEVVERVADFGNIGALTVEQLLTSEMFQLFSTDDRKTEMAFARVAEILAREDTGNLDRADREILGDFRRQIGDALPYGRTEVTRLVQEAVAEYLAARRKTGAEGTKTLRDEAKAQVKTFLQELLE